MEVRTATRTAVTLVAIILYAALANLYIHELTRKYWDVHTVKLLYLYLNLLMIVFYLFDKKAGIVGVWHKEFNRCCIGFVIANYCVWVANWHGLLGDPENPVAEHLFICLNGSILVATIAILINGLVCKTFRYY